MSQLKEPDGHGAGARHRALHPVQGQRGWNCMLGNESEIL
jgi:hypothetical protein